MKRIGIVLLVVAMALLAAAPAGAGKPQCPSEHPSCPDPPDDPSASVELEVVASLVWAQEASDTIVYTISVDPFSEDLVVTSSLPAELELESVVGEVGVWRQEYSVAPHYPPPPDQDTLTNTVKAWIDGEVVATASADVALDYGLEECVFTADPQNPQLMTSSTCIWKPPVPGDWKVMVDPTPVARQGANNIQITLRDHIPGNWCPIGVTEKWRDGDDDVCTVFTIPDWNAVSVGEPVCPFGGQAGDFFGVGTPGSFYLVASGYVSVEQVPPGSTCP